MPRTKNPLEYSWTELSPNQLSHQSANNPGKSYVMSHLPQEFVPKAPSPSPRRVNMDLFHDISAEWGCSSFDVEPPVKSPSDNAMCSTCHKNFCKRGKTKCIFCKKK